MAETKEKFEDRTSYLAKGLIHIDIAKQWFQMLKADSKQEAKVLLTTYIQKCDYIINNVYDRLPEPVRADYRESIKCGDTVFFDAIAEKLLKLDEQQKATLEIIVDAMNKGEIINFIDK